MCIHATGKKFATFFADVAKQLLFARATFGTMQHIHFELAGTGAYRGWYRWSSDVTWRTVYGIAKRYVRSEFLYDVRIFLGHGGAEKHWSDGLVGECPEEPVTILPLTHPDLPTLRVQIRDHPEMLLEAIKARDEQLAHALLAASAGVEDILTARDVAADNFSGEHNISPLHASAERGFFEVARILLIRGADPNVKSHSGQTPLHVAASTEIAALLLKWGAEIDAVNDSGQTPLMECAKFGFVRLVRFLLDCGANATLEDKEGQTALMLIIRHDRDVKVEAVLRAHLAANARNARIQ